MNSADYVPDLEAHEGRIPWLYCDSRGFVTTGVGNLVKDADACALLPLYDLSAPLRTEPPPEASEAAKRSAFCLILGAYDDTKAAMYYRTLSSLRLTNDAIDALLEQRLMGEFFPGLLKLCPGIEGFPLPARRALVDMVFNLGVGGLGKFPHLLAACNSADWATAAAQCHRSSCRETRNLWTSSMFVDASVTPTSLTA